ncbi:MAG: hypothetical protein NTY37_03740 [Methanothrix sp.]|nr:hypothetical protein [Methanothrix sp.]
MKISTKPTSLMLVGILFICIFLGPGLAEPQLNGLEQLNKLNHHQKSSDLGILKVGADTIYFPWYRQTQSVRPALSCSISTSLKKEEILMDSSNSMASVRDLLAINSLKHRDLLYNDSQNGDPNYQGLVNSLDISVSGKGNDKSADEAASSGWQEDGIGGRELDNSDIHHAGNYLSVDVHDISVSAINTMQGGSAVATSNIIIEPVQIIVCPSEVDVKLR